MINRNSVLLCGFAVLLCAGCANLLQVDQGRMDFVKGKYHQSRLSMETAARMHKESSEKSVAAITWNEAQKLFTRGAYSPMYRDAISAYFYMALDALAENRSDDAMAALNQMLAVHEQIAIQFSNATQNYMSDEMKAKDKAAMLSYIPSAESLIMGNKQITPEQAEQIRQTVNEARAKSELAFNEIWDKSTAELQRSDQYADNGLAQFYNPAAMLLTSFLMGFNGQPQAKETAASCLASIKGMAPISSNAVSKCLDEDSSAFHGKLLVIVATGHGPILVSHNIDLNGIIGTKIFAYTDLPSKDDSRKAMNPSFDPLVPIVMQHGEDSQMTEVATEMFNNLNAEFQHMKSRLMREQVIRVLIRDVMALSASVYVGVEHNRAVGIAMGVSWAIIRQFLMNPELRCMQKTPWAYHVAFMDIPEDRTVNLSHPALSWQQSVSIPDDYDSAVLYVDLPGDLQSVNTVKVLPVNLANTVSEQ